MIYEVNVNELGDTTNSYLNRVRYGHNTCVIKQGTEEVGAIINIELFNRLKRLESDFKDVRNQMMKFGQTMTEEEADKLANEAVEFARKHK